MVVDRDGMAPGESPEGFLEDDDWVSLHGVKIKKPFVEKPASGEDHNVYIYYPYSMVRRLMVLQVCGERFGSDLVHRFRTQEMVATVGRKRCV